MNVLLYIEEKDKYQYIGRYGKERRGEERREREREREEREREGEREGIDEIITVEERGGAEGVI